MIRTHQICLLYTSSDAIPLESDDTDLNRELDEINSLGVSKEAEYTQASFFFDQNGQARIGTIHTEDENNNQFMRQFEQDRKAALTGKYNYLNPKKSATLKRMVTQLQPDVRAYLHGAEVIKR